MRSKPKKKRGRPAKALKVITSSVDGDLISQLQNAADSDNESVASSTSSRGRPRLTDEEKQRRAEEKAQAKKERDEAKAQAKKDRDEAKAKAKKEKEAEKRNTLIGEINTLNSEVSTAMDLSDATGSCGAEVDGH